MELLPKKATEKIGEAIRKKLPKKSVAFSGSENGLFKKGSSPAGCENGLFKKGSSPAGCENGLFKKGSSPAGCENGLFKKGSSPATSRMAIGQILCAEDLQKYVTFWASGC